MIQRTAILDGVRNRLETFFGAAGYRPLFRKTFRGKWQPGNTMRPAATVNDDGSEKTGADNSDVTKNQRLKFQIILDLAENFMRDGKDIRVDWSAELERIRMAVQNYDPKAGVLSMNVTNDTPFDVVVQDGAIEPIWIIECECEFFIEFCEFGASEATMKAAVLAL